jgi:hypothetical protein
MGIQKKEEENISISIWKVLSFSIIMFYHTQSTDNYLRYFKKSFLEEAARWWIVDICIAQQQLTIPNKENKRTPKVTHGVP